MSFTTAVPKALKINNKLISFPHINNNINAEPTNRLMVDIIELNEHNKPSNFITTSLKYVFCEYYPQYSQYLKKHPHTTLQNEIHNYYDTVILAEIEYKYKIGQFGYIYNGHSLEKSFVIITEQLHAQKEIFFLHGQLKKYKYQHYDITSPTPKTLAYNDYDLSSSASGNECKSNSKWTTESLFTPIDGTMAPTNDATNYIIELLNWKICREDYLLKKVNRIKMTLGLKGEEISELDTPVEPVIHNKTISNNNINNISSNEDTPTDDEQTSYLPESDEKSSYYYTSNDSTTDTTTDADNDISATASTIPSTPTCTSTEDNDEKLLLLNDFGYYEEKFECYTLKGELFVALNRNNKGKNEEVTIKKMTPYDEPAYVPSIVIDARLVKKALISRHLQTDNTLIRNSIVKYIDFFQSKTNYFSVIERDFSINLAQFVVKSLQYIEDGKLSFSEYHETIKYLLWRLSAIIHWLHTDMTCNDLDVCPENIMLSRAEFIQNSDGSVTINLQIEVKFIDFGVKELLQLCNYDISNANKNKFQTNYNKHYLELKNGQYIAPSREDDTNDINISEYHYDRYAVDMWRFGMVIYYCYFGNYPYNEIPSDNTKTDNDIGYWSVHNGKLNEYIQTKSPFKCIDPKVISLINGLLNIDENKRFKSINVLQHKWFNSFYKAYLSIMK